MQFTQKSIPESYESLVKEAMQNHAFKDTKCGQTFKEF